MTKNKMDVLSVSKHTQKDMDAHYPQSGRTHRVIYEGVDFEKFGPQYDQKRAKNVRAQYGIPDKPYLFTLFTLEPRKNLLSIIDAFKLLKHDHPELDIALVIGGRKGWKTDEPYGNIPDVHYTGYIQDTDLACLYSQALAFCYLSIYEGFGLPPLESMACGTPVLYAANSSMVEILQDKALAVPEKDIHAVAKAMKKFILDDVLRKKYEAEGYKHALHFTWQKCANETLAYYAELINKYEAS